jgi:hypothetical protein
MTREGSKAWQKKMMKLAARKRKDKKRDFGSALFLLASSYCFPLWILLLLLIACARQKRERAGSPPATTKKRKKAQSREKREKRERETLLD